MKTVPARLRLIDFSDEVTNCEPPPETVAAPALVKLNLVPEQLLCQQELNAAVSQARADAEALGAEQMQQMREAHEQELERAQSKAIEDQADNVLSKITEEFAALGPDIANRLFEKCRSVLGALARDQAVGELVAVLSTIVQSNCRLTVRGPKELLEALRKRLDDQSLNVDWQEEQVTDISITVDDTIIETQLSEWLGSKAVIVDG